MDLNKPILKFFFGYIFVYIFFVFSPYFLSNYFFKGLPLDKDWSICLLEKHLSDLEHCNWIASTRPEIKSNNDFDNETIFFKKTFELPSFCLNKTSNCEIFLGVLTESFEVLLNGKIIHRDIHHKNYGYTQAYPTRFFLSPDIAKRENNELIIKMLTSVNMKHGINRGPTGIYSAKESRFLLELITVSVVIFPLFSLFLILLLILFTHAIFNQNKKTNLSKSYVIFCVFSALSLLTLTRVPRQYLSEKSGYSLHYCFRFLREFGLINLIQSCVFGFNKTFNVIKYLYLFFAFTFFAFFSLSEYFQHSYFLLKNIFPILLSSLILLNYIFIKGYKSLFDFDKSFSIKISLTLLILQAWDGLAIHGAVTDIYFSRITLLLEAVFFGRILFLQAFLDFKNNEINKTIAFTATQVAHDIRSPVAALKTLENELDQIPIQTRLIMKNAIFRIQDIANNLISQNRAYVLRDDNSSLPLIKKVMPLSQSACVWISGLLDSLVSEKRLQYKSRLKIQINYNFSSDSYSLFAFLDPIEFKRALSNMIDNAVEAISEPSSGQVQISLLCHSEKALILIQDTGVGIPIDILPKLAQRGATFGKKEGSGLGLWSARLLVESCGGTLSLHTMHNKEYKTTVEISIPHIAPPKWFSSKINLRHKRTIIILADDKNIHKIFSNRFEKFSFIKTHYFTFAGAFTDFVSDLQLEELHQCLFIVDFEISLIKPTGLDLIESLGIAQQSILVTSIIDEITIQERCFRLDIKILPKIYIEKVNITNE